METLYYDVLYARACIRAFRSAIANRVGVCWFFWRNIAPLGISAPHVTVPDLNCPPFFGPLASGAAQQDSWKSLICIACTFSPEEAFLSFLFRVGVSELLLWWRPLQLDQGQRRRRALGDHARPVRWLQECVCVCVSGLEEAKKEKRLH